jgi:hypothetical protein
LNFNILDVHERLLLSPEIDLLSRFLLPLAGPEEFDDEDNGKLPIDLQYLPPTKEREEDPDIRIMLLETLMMVRFTLFCFWMFFSRCSLLYDR